MNEERFWQIGKFSKELGRHISTITDWFNLLEERGVHYVSRSENDQRRIFTELDLNIGLYMVKKRNEGWAIDPIIEMIRDGAIETRPFPEDFKAGDSTIALEMTDQFKDMILESVKSMMEEQIQSHVQQLQENNRTLLIAQRQQEVTNELTKNRIRSQLRITALKEWSKLPAAERLIKVGLFTKQEDSVKREIFIEEYVLKHYEERLKAEYEEN